MKYLDKHRKPTINKALIKSKAVKAVLLDLDGVLYDSLPQYVAAWTQAFVKVDIALPEREVYVLEGMPGNKMVEELFLKYKHRPVTEEELHIVTKEKTRIFASEKSTILSGAMALLKAIHDSNLPMCIVTGSSKATIKEEIAHDFSPYLTQNLVVNGEDITIGKPHPDPYLAGCKKLSVDPKDVVVIENAPLGVRAAHDAGCFCLAVNTGVLGDDVLLEQGAAAVFEGCDALAGYWGEILAEIQS